MENYYLAKQKLFTLCEHAVINIDDAYGKRMAQDIACPCSTYAIETAADLNAKELRMSSRGVIFNLIINGEQMNVRLGIPGKFSVYNAMAAFACCLALETATGKLW